MARTPLLARSGLWRLTRHPIARRWYERLQTWGLFLAQLDRFERSTAPVDGSVDGAHSQPTVEVVSATDHSVGALEDAGLAPSDRILLACRGGRTVGWCCLGDRPVYVPELQRRLQLPGSYLWRLYVEPPARGAGVGTAIVRAAIGCSRRDLETDRISALVAPDNLPSRRAFERVGFTPRQRYTSVGCLGRAWHRCRAID